MRISSTYNSKNMVPRECLQMNKDESAIQEVKSRLNTKVLNFSNHARGAYRKPYKALLREQT